jgi:hypothetical protein
MLLGMAQPAMCDERCSVSERAVAAPNPRTGPAGVELKVKTAVIQMTAIRKLLIASAAALAVSGLASAASAQASATVSTTSTGTIFQPILLAKNTDLSFGTVVRPVSGSGTVTVDPTTGARTLSGSGALLATGPNAAAARATYTVTGEGGQTFSITVPATFNMTRSGGSDTIQVTLTPTATTGTLSGVLGATGTTTFGVGGAIPVSNSTASGAYSGTFNVIVAYN